MTTLPFDFVLSGSGLDLYRFAGALWALEGLGYTFRGRAGVSGGSIITALTAAGYKPGSELNGLLLKFTPITDLLDVEVAMPWTKGRATVLGGSTPWWWPFKSHGLIKGKKLEKLLAQYLKAKGVVHFKDFKTPVKVFTTDMTPKAKGSRQVEWSTEKTPGALVAPAVIASCRIPGVFQAAVLDGGAHVDGGVWANFPVDCWNLHDGEDDKGEGTLGIFFGLDSNVDSGFGFVPALVNVMISSRMAEDVEDSPRAIIIPLEAGNALDFFISKDKASELINDGYRAVARWSNSR